MSNPTVTDEAVQDLRALIVGMDHEQLKEFVINSILANDAQSLAINKEVKLDSRTKILRDSFTLVFLK